MIVRLLKKIWQFFRLVLHWVFRFCNLLEPDVSYPVLSVSKLAAWGTLFSTIWITINNPQSEALAGSVAAQTVAMGNYAFRRWVQHKAKKGSFADPKEPTAPKV